VYFGDDYVKQFSANLNQYYRLEENSNLEVHRICQVIVHPNFVYTQVSEYFDFVLYKLCEDSELAKNGTIVPIQLNRDNDLPTDHEVLTVTGWGDTNPNESSPSNELMMVNVNYINNTECTTPPYLYSKDDITDDMMCAGALVGGGRDACGGDGGGPLIIQGSKFDNHLLVGIVSWGFDNTCALPEYPGVYSRVSHVIDWILENGCSFIDGECDIQTN
jgi:secreted trypsin-like serine protease